MSFFICTSAGGLKNDRMEEAELELAVFCDFTGRVEDGDGRRI
jgi:hypothetical protein